jgi:hypothetical protein
VNQAALFEPLDGAALSPPPPCCLCMREQCVCVRERERERKRERKKERKKDHNPRNASIYTGECWCLPRLDTATRVSRIKNPFTNQFTLLPLLSPNSPYIFFVQFACKLDLSYTNRDTKVSAPQLTTLSCIYSQQSDSGRCHRRKVVRGDHVPQRWVPAHD